MVKNLPANLGYLREETRVRSLGQEDPLEEGRATHASILAWRIPWTEDAGMLQSIVSQKSWTWVEWISIVHVEEGFLYDKRKVLIFKV